MYKLHYNGKVIIRLVDGAQIPISTDNADYLEYLAWVKRGNTPLPADPPPPPDPKQVDDQNSMRTVLSEYETMRGNLQAIAAHLTSLQTDANALSNLTIAGNLATTQAQLQIVLRTLGTDIAVLSGDLQTIVDGNAKALKAIKVFAQSQM